MDTRDDAPPMPPEIRPARETDHAAVVACVRAAYATYLPRMDREPAPMHADYAALIAQETVYVLAVDGVLRGVLVMMPRDGSLFIENVAVDPAWQGRGLGRWLLAFAEQAARAARVASLRLYTNEVMTENLAFYRRLGFVEEARRVEGGYARVYLRNDLAPA